MRKFYNKIFIIAFIGLSFIALSAKEYSVLTDNDDVLCTLKAISPQLNVINEISSFQTSLRKNTTLNNKTEKNDNSIDKIKECVAVIIKIENNSEKPIWINKGEYIEVISKNIIPVEEILSIYEIFISKKRNDFLTNSLIGTFCLTITPVSGFVTLCSCGSAFDKKRMFSRVRRGDKLVFGFLSGVFTLVFFGLGVISIYKAIKDKKYINLATANKEILANYSHIKNSSVKYLESDESKYKIKPGQKFKDVFFIYTQKDLLDNIKARLNYSFF